MKWIAVITLLSYSCITASATGKVLSPDNSNPKVRGSNEEGDVESELLISDRLICNKLECYPKVFEPSNDWQEVRPEQRLPAGLDIRINLETGKKEAKMLDAASISFKDSETSDTDKDTLSQNYISDALDDDSIQLNDVGSEEKKLTKNNDVEEPKQGVIEDAANLQASMELILNNDLRSDGYIKSDYEFSREFEKIKELEKLSSDESWDQMESLLDDLVEYSHDYGHGFKILSNEFELLYRLSLSEKVPINVRELSARIIVSSLRNNPPTIDYINVNFADTLEQICKELPGLHTSKLKILVKRFLSIIDVLLDRSTDPKIDEKALWLLYSSNDSLIKVKVLEIIAKLYRQNDPLYIKQEFDDLSTIEAWANELVQMIQSKDIDEYQLRLFFDAILNLKKHFGSKIKADSRFLNWLIDEIESRKEKLNDEVYKRDLEQLDFDLKLIESRHEVFGNQKALRIKQFNEDEEDVNDEL